MTPCALQTLTTLAVTMDVSSRIFVNATAPYYGNGNGAYNGAYQVTQRNAADTTTLASTPNTSYLTQDADLTTHTLNSVGVLFSGTSGTTASTAAPGNYLLKFTIDLA